MLLRKIVFIISSLLVLGSCAPEYFMVKDLEEDLGHASVMLVFPDYVDAINSKSGLDMMKVDQYTFDSIFYNSDFLPYIFRDSFLIDFKAKMIAKFESKGFAVYTDTMWSSFFSAESPSYIFDFTYLQIEEVFTTYYDSEIHVEKNRLLQDSEMRSKTFVKLRNTLRLNAWVDFTYVQDTSLTKYSLFMDSKLTDEVDGSFVKKDEKYVYKYSLDTLDVERSLQLDTTAANEITETALNFIINQNLEHRIGELYDRYPTDYYYLQEKGVIEKTQQVPTYHIVKIH